MPVFKYLVALPTTSHAFNEFLEQSGLNQKIYETLDSLDVDDVNALAKAGAQIRQWVIDTPFQGELEKAITSGLRQAVLRNP